MTTGRNGKAYQFGQSFHAPFDELIDGGYTALYQSYQQNNNSTAHKTIQNQNQNSINTKNVKKRNTKSRSTDQKVQEVLSQVHNFGLIDETLFKDFVNGVEGSASKIEKLIQFYEYNVEDLDSAPRADKDHLHLSMLECANLLSIMRNNKIIPILEEVWEWLSTIDLNVQLSQQHYKIETSKLTEGLDAEIAGQLQSTFENMQTASHQAVDKVYVVLGQGGSKQDVQQAQQQLNQTLEKAAKLEEVVQRGKPQSLILHGDSNQRPQAPWKDILQMSSDDKDKEIMILRQKIDIFQRTTKVQGMKEPQKPRKELSKMSLQEKDAELAQLREQVQKYEQIIKMQQAQQAQQSEGDVGVLGQLDKAVEGGGDEVTGSQPQRRPRTPMPGSRQKDQLAEDIRKAQLVREELQDLSEGGLLDEALNKLSEMQAGEPLTQEKLDYINELIQENQMLKQKLKELLPIVQGTFEKIQESGGTGDNGGEREGGGGRGSAEPPKEEKQRTKKGKGKSRIQQQKQSKKAFPKRPQTANANINQEVASDTEDEQEQEEKPVDYTQVDDIEELRRMLLEKDDQLREKKQTIKEVRKQNKEMVQEFENVAQIIEEDMGVGRSTSQNSKRLVRSKSRNAEELADSQEKGKVGFSELAEIGDEQVDQEYQPLQKQGSRGSVIKRQENSDVDAQTYGYKQMKRTYSLHQSGDVQQQKTYKEVVKVTVCSTCNQLKRQLRWWRERGWMQKKHKAQLSEEQMTFDPNQVLVNSKASFKGIDPWVALQTGLPALNVTQINKEEGEEQTEEEGQDKEEGVQEESTHQQGVVDSLDLSQVPIIQELNQSQDVEQEHSTNASVCEEEQDDRLVGEILQRRKQQKKQKTQGQRMSILPQKGGTSFTPDLGLSVGGTTASSLQLPVNKRRPTTLGSRQKSIIRGSIAMDDRRQPS